MGRTAPIYSTNCVQLRRDDAVDRSGFATLGVPEALIQIWASDSDALPKLQSCVVV
jgi:hypothetical protein